MTLEILIPTLPERAAFYKRLTDNLMAQNKENKNWIDVWSFSDARGRGITTGQKRNEMLARAKGDYVWFIDDDDIIMPGALRAVYDACQTGADVIGINGIMTTNGLNEVFWEIRLGHPYCATIRDGKEIYLRHPNHITPMKREHAQKIKFPEITLGEDYAWACSLKDSGLLKTQEIVDQLVYHYDFRTK